MLIDIRDVTINYVCTSAVKFWPRWSKIYITFNGDVGRVWTSRVLYSYRICL